MDGALIIDKPADMTSHDVVARVRRIVNQRRVGHTGTLDPFATGVLVVMVGRATRLAQFLSGAEKEYEAVIRLGYRTDTGDVTGTRIEESQRTTEIHRDEIESAMTSLRGEFDQTPPMYSAKKIGGRKLYELARRGEEAERRPVRINVSSFECLSSNDLALKIGDDGTMDLPVRVVCSAGTYIRTLAEDFGKRLGLGAHLAELRRTRAGAFGIAEAITLEQLAEFAAHDSLAKVFISPDSAVDHLPAIDLDSDQTRQVLNGVDIPTPTVDVPGPVRLRGPNGNLIAIGVFDAAQSALHPQVVIGDQSSLIHTSP